MKNKVELPREEVQDRNWWNKLKDVPYADTHTGATPKSIWIGDTVLLKK